MTHASDHPAWRRSAPLPLLARLRVLRQFHTGPAVVRDLAGPVVRVPIGPRLVVAPFVPPPRKAPTTYSPPPATTPWTS